MTLQEIERSLLNVYLKIWNEIKKDKDYPDNLAALKTKYNRLVYDNTRAAIQQTAIIGIERINRQLKLQSYITKKDIDVIEKNTDKQVDSFWRKVQVLIQEEQSPVLGGGFRDLFSVNAISAVFTTLKETVVSKVLQVADTIRGKPKLRWETAGDGKVCPICQALNGREFLEEDMLGSGIPNPGEDGTHYNCRCQVVLV